MKYLVKLNKMFKESVSDVDVVNVDAEPSGLTPEEQTELDNTRRISQII